MSGATAVQRSLRRLASQADLGRRLALEEARDRARAAGPATGSSPWTCARLRLAAVLAHAQLGAERDPLEPAVGGGVELGGRLDVGERVVADLRGLARARAARRCTSWNAEDAATPTNSTAMPEVHEVAAVAAAVAPHERDERDRHRLARIARRARTPRQNSWPTAANTNAANANISSAATLVTPSATSTDEHGDAASAGRPRLRAQVRGGRPPPGDHRADARQQHEEQRQRTM